VNNYDFSLYNRKLGYNAIFLLRDEEIHISWSSCEVKMISHRASREPIFVTAASQLHKAISMVMAHTRTDVLVF
jgi:hypothetical protein